MTCSPTLHTPAANTVADTVAGTDLLTPMSSAEPYTATVCGDLLTTCSTCSRTRASRAAHAHTPLGVSRCAAAESIRHPHGTPCTYRPRGGSM